MTPNSYTCPCCGKPFTAAQADFELSYEWLKNCHSSPAAGRDELPSFLPGHFKDTSVIGENWFRRLGDEPQGVYYTYRPGRSRIDPQYNSYNGQPVFSCATDKNGLPRLELAVGFSNLLPPPQQLLCPSCHYRLPPELFLAQRVTVQRVGIIGQKTSGKTVLVLLLLMNEWLTRGGCQQLSGSAFGDCHPLAVKNGLTQMKENYARDGSLPQPTDTAWLPPVVIPLRFTQADGSLHLHLLALFDLAGEKYAQLNQELLQPAVVRKGEVASYLQLLAAMDSCLLLLDCQRDLLEQRSEQEADARPESLRDFQYLFQNTALLKDKPVALALTKCDMLYPDVAPKTRFYRLRRNGGLAGQPKNQAYDSRFEEVFRLLPWEKIPGAQQGREAERLAAVYRLFDPNNTDYDKKAFLDVDYHLALQGFLKEWLAETEEGKYQKLCQTLDSECGSWAIFLTAALGRQPYMNKLLKEELVSIRPADPLAWLVLNHNSHEAGAEDYTDLLADTAPAATPAPAPPFTSVAYAPEPQKSAAPAAYAPQPYIPPQKPAALPDADKTLDPELFAEDSLPFASELSAEDTLPFAADTTLYPLDTCFPTLSKHEIDPDRTL